jgi:hypothetical protein
MGKLLDLFRPTRQEIVPKVVDQLEPVSGFSEMISRWRWNNAAKTARAQVAYFDAVVDLWESIYQLDVVRERHKVQRVRLENIDTIVATEVVRINNALFEEEERGKDLRGQAQVRDWDRRTETEEAKRRYNKLMGITEEKPEQPRRSKEAEDAAKEADLRAEMVRARALHEEQRAELIKRWGGDESKLDDRQKAILRQMDEAIEAMFKDAGL